MAATISRSDNALPRERWVRVPVPICASAGAFLGTLEYGWIGTNTDGIAGGVVGLLATAWLPLVSGVGPGVAFGVAFGLSVALAIMAPRAWGSPCASAPPADDGAHLVATPDPADAQVPAYSVE